MSAPNLDPNLDMLIDAGFIMGKLMKHSPVEWENLIRDCAAENSDFRYRRELELLAEMRLKLWQMSQV